MMEVDTNPLANWLIFFVNHREANEKTHAVMMEFCHSLLWQTKRVVHESLNIGFVDISTPEGELLKLTFDIDGIPTALVIDHKNFYKLPWENTGWQVSDIINFSLYHFKSYDRHALRYPVEEGSGLWREYMYAYIAQLYFEPLMSNAIKYNNMMHNYTGIKIDFKKGYEHFGKKNKY